MYRVKQMVAADKVYRHGYSGKNVTIAVLDSGIYADHPDLSGRLVVFRDFVHQLTHAYDDNGHGTHICGILCGNGYCSQRRICGMATDAKIVSLKVLDHEGNGDSRTVIRALEWVRENRIRYQIRMLNFSVGFLPGARVEEQKELLQRIDELWDLGITVVAAAGNNGPKMRSVTVPGISRKIITVGALDDGQKTAHYNRGYSGRGPTGCCIVKPEILAPGSGIMSLKNQGMDYVAKSGTSMATPVVCGALALALEKNNTLAPADLKLLLYRTVKPVTEGIGQKSWGLLQVDPLIEQIE